MTVMMRELIHFTIETMLSMMMFIVTRFVIAQMRQELVSFN